MEILTPKEVAKAKREATPDFVYEAFNNLLIKNYNPYEIIIIQNDVINEIIRLSPMDITKDDIYREHWLDVEEDYCENGWEVEYDKPGFGESYPARFVFKPKNRLG